MNKGDSMKTKNKNMMDLQVRTPYAIWFQRNDFLEASISVVNDLYRYEIFDRVTGKRLYMDSRLTLADAKLAVFDLIQYLEPGT